MVAKNSSTKQDGDDEAYQQRGGSAEIDRPARELAAPLEEGELVARKAALAFVESPPQLFECATAIDDTRETIRHHAEQPRDPGEQEYGGDRELDRMADGR